MDEILKNNTYKILELFIEFPVKDFSVRGIARNLKLSHATVLKYIAYLEKLNLVKKKEATLYPTYFANTENQKYKFYKRNWLVFKINESGLIEHLQKEVLPSSIVLFGSGAKATSTEKSDIDIFVEANEAKLDFTKYEKKLNHKINLLFEQNINNLSKELRNNMINGIVLYGFIKIQ
ncbi:MAG TPA: nucleotidyltransferase domain-containing protein [Candidatus Nanoarchaeia archaeon]|nr:nucleotidyltransferase domain-containing protein [Candidatus Nanoarchaeia archaeon]